MAATATQRGKSQSNLLHGDFSSPVLKTWGNQRFIRYDGVEGKEEGVAGEYRSAFPAPSPVRVFTQRLPRIGAPKVDYIEDDCGLEELREKLMGHLREAADRMKLDIPPIKPAGATAMEQGPSSSAFETAIPWTLRTRRVPNIRLRTVASGKKEKHKFSISLSKEEIEEDVFALTGSRPRRRPKKRPRVAQRQLDAIFPGLLLSEITPETYRVPE
ncbi:uncharacterized protein LOC110027772 [Phalaenopsis equestris]|uniref:uncharacterized protein LOC110027772 n=1 Tax=Phalaenopsis equestris TaxID=78828 RepID=UPI0009E5246D|nr:uncharacterized protein LOC110027772 [Phalaenopsis equestris]